MKSTAKLLCLLLTLCLLLGLTACGSETKSAAEATTATETASTEQETTEESALAETTAAAAEDLTLAETTLVDTDDCTVIAKAYRTDEFWGPTIQLYLENKTSDRTLMFAIDGASVDGVMCDPFWAEEVAAGKKSNSDVSWSTSTLAENGILYLQNAEFTIRVYNSDDYSAEDLVDQPCSLSLEGGKGEAVSAPDFDFPEQVLADGPDVKAVVKDFEPDGDLGPTLVLYLENSTDKTLMFSADNTSVNGFLCDPCWTTTVAAGKVAYVQMSFGECDLSANGITAFQAVEFTLKAYDNDDWSADPLLDSLVTVNLGA
ncbi:MAG: hypothetical protein VB055_09305 [Oscillospiraceae bacterium]|nr:hypothetical protein [Oscillospiraceae bacterium]